MRQWYIYAAVTVNMLFACYLETEINCEPEPEPCAEKTTFRGKDD